MKKKVLIICPHLHLGGGVSNYFNSLKGHLNNDADFFFIGATSAKESFYKKPFNLIYDIISLSLHLLRSGRDYKIIHINPSFVWSSIMRDGLLLLVSKLFHKKCIVFFRGWNSDFADYVSRRFSYICRFVYNRADAFIILSSEFKEKLRCWGFDQPIYLETTTVDNRLLNTFSLGNRKKRNLSKQESIHLLFLSRIEREKGIIETIDAVRILADSYPGLFLSVAGTGPYLDYSMKYSQEIGIGHLVQFKGYVTGTYKQQLLESANVFVFPTYYGEGMPNCVLEAMAFGLPVITRPVGGIKDFFVDGRFGYLTKSKDPQTIASLIDKVVSDRKAYDYMSSEAFKYAEKNFLASRVTKRLRHIYDILDHETEQIHSFKD